METSVFKFIALSDTHITATRTSLQGKVSDLIVDAIVKYHKDAAFIVNCGDLSNDNFKETGGIKRESYIYNDIWYTKAMRVGLPHYYDGFGNHDIFVGKAPANNDDMRVFLTKKNKKRKANGEITALCDKNMNYEWQIKKGDITFHFIMLNLFPKAPVSKATEEIAENEPDGGKRTDYNSYNFLKQRLEQIPTSSLDKHPVFLFHHYGFIFNSFKRLHEEHWPEKEIEAYINLIKKYNIACITYGHFHSTQILYLNDTTRDNHNKSEKYKFTTSYDNILKNTPYYKEANGKNQTGINTLICGATFSSEKMTEGISPDESGEAVLMGIPFEELENIQESIPIGGYVVCTVTIYPEKPQNIKLSCVAKRVKRAGTDITESNVIFKTYDISWPRRK